MVNERMVKTVKFKNYKYIGDPVNTVRIFNEFEVDELVIADIRASVEKREPNFGILGQIADECFMPLAFGGGITNEVIAKKVFNLGYEKIIINTSTFINPQQITQLAKIFGSQAIMAAMDIRKNILGRYECFSLSGTKNQKIAPFAWAKRLEELGVGEILLTSIDREGTWKGFDIELIKQVTQVVNIPVIAQGGAASIEDICKAVKEGQASAVALGSMVVFQAKDLGVVINFPDKEKLNSLLS
jgi:cyclase